jgi:hypothetical protein
MGEIGLNQHVLYFLLAFIAAVIGIQTYLQLRIRNILQALAMNSDTMVQSMRKMVSPGKKAEPNENSLKSCQFCKHRLAYINIEKNSGAEEDFYHKCALRNAIISLNDSCHAFEVDKDIFQ